MKTKRRRMAKYIRQIFTSRERKRRLFFVDATPFHLHHYPRRAGRGVTTSWEITIWPRAVEHAALVFLKRRKQTAFSLQLRQQYYLQITRNWLNLSVGVGRQQSLDWTSGLDWWTGLVDWTGGMTLKITFQRASLVSWVVWNPAAFSVYSYTVVLEQIIY